MGEFQPNQQQRIQPQFQGSPLAFLANAVSTPQPVVQAPPKVQKIPTQDTAQRVDNGLGTDLARQILGSGVPSTAPPISSPTVQPSTGAIGSGSASPTAGSFGRSLDPVFLQSLGGSPREGAGPDVIAEARRGVEGLLNRLVALAREGL